MDGLQPINPHASFQSAMRFIQYADKLERWRMEYNHERTHSSLNNIILAEFIRSIRKGERL
nr:integrase core domain-containing protein [Buttiauxella agrestis]